MNDAIKNVEWINLQQTIEGINTLDQQIHDLQQERMREINRIYQSTPIPESCVQKLHKAKKNGSEINHLRKILEIYWIPELFEIGLVPSIRIVYNVLKDNGLTNSGITEN